MNARLNARLGKLLRIDAPRPGESARAGSDTASCRSVLLRAILGVIVCGASALSGVAAADPDPCNFADLAPAYSWERVMSCYESVPFQHDDLVNVVEHLRAIRDTSDLREVFQERFGWRERLAELDDPTTTEDFPGDFAFQMAVIGNHKDFLNPHWRYYPPACYFRIVNAFVPFEFGSTLRDAGTAGAEQIIFIESAPFLPDLYEQFTGIDAEQYVGMRVVSINDTPVLDYFRRFGSEVLRFDANDGQNLNEVLDNAAYSLRIVGRYDLPPDRAFDRYVLEASDGTLLTVEMPWVFAPRAAFGFQDDFATSSTEAFHRSCLQDRPEPFDLDVPSSLTFSPAGPGSYSVSSGAQPEDPVRGVAVDWASDGVTGNGDDDAVRVGAVDADAFNGFPFFDQTYGTGDIWIGADGHITFGAPDASFGPREPARHVNGPPRISAFLDDLYPGCFGDVYADVRLDRIVVTWDDVAPYWNCSGNVTVTVQAVLHDSGTIDLRFIDVGMTDAVIGIAEGAGVGGAYLSIDLTEELPAVFDTGAIYEWFRYWPAPIYNAMSDDASAVPATESSDLTERRSLVRKLKESRRAAAETGKSARTTRSVDVLEQLFPKNDGAVAYQLGDTTIIRLDDFGQTWEDEVVAAADIACDRSERLVIDLRNNGGGQSQPAAWLKAFLFPEYTELSDLAWQGRLLRSNPLLEELRQRAQVFADYYGQPPGCRTLQEPECYTDVNTGATFTAAAWEETVVETRGGVDETLSPLIGRAFTAGTYRLPGADAIACPGRFRGTTMIVLSNGTGCSASHFFTEFIREDVTVVTMGGFAGETLGSGICRGGSTQSRSEVWPFLVDYYAMWINDPPVTPMPYLSRLVRSNIEYSGIYDSSGTELRVDEPAPVGDVHIDVWGDSPESDPIVYRRVIDAMADSDGDGVIDLFDNCPDDANADQANFDGDGSGNACDPDSDNDGVFDPDDTAPLDPTSCADADGDTCDDCAEGVDGVGVLPDNDPANDGSDMDGDGLCDAGDGIWFTPYTTHAIVGQNLFRSAAYRIAPQSQSVDLLPAFLSAAANMVALDVKANGTILFAVEAPVTVPNGNRTIRLLPGVIYRWTGTKIKVKFKPSSVGISGTKINALDQVGGRYYFSVDAAKSVRVDGKLYRLLPSQVWRLRPNGNPKLKLVRGFSDKGFDNVDGLDVLPDGRIAISSKNNGPGYGIFHENVYIWDSATDSVGLSYRLSTLEVDDNAGFTLIDKD